MFCYPEEYELTVYPMNAGDVREIDSLDELADEDPAWRQKIKEAEKNDGKESDPAQD